MTYAILSDIHGNVHALRAALADAKARGADKYLLLGDYTNSFPWGNEVADILRGLRPAVAVRGNGEGYLAALHGKDPAVMTDEQFKPVYWAYQSLSPENLAYMLALPETAVVTDADAGGDIYLAHFMRLFYRTAHASGDTKIPLFYSSHFRRQMETAAFSHADYLARAREQALARADVRADIDALPPGVYLFGHNHLQFHMAYAGRLFINPGSCGEALDGDNTAAYTLLTCAGGVCAVDERRVRYDTKAASEGLTASGYAAYTPMWCEIMRREMWSGKDYFSQFVAHLTATNRALGRDEYPVSGDTWAQAVDTWAWA